MITATVAENTNISSTVYLTVNKRELNITLGTSDILREIGAQTQYSQPYVVQVADGSGEAVKNATVSLDYTVLLYKKGQFFVSEGDDPEWFQVYTGCSAEDINRNGVLDLGEDRNGNNQLDPQNPAVFAAESELEPTLQSGTIITDENGFGYFSLVYPQSNGMWTTLELTASATAQNVEAKATYVSYLPILADELADVGDDLPNRVSPYGAELDCTNTN